MQCGWGRAKVKGTWRESHTGRRSVDKVDEIESNGIRRHGGSRGREEAESRGEGRQTGLVTKRFSRRWIGGTSTADDTMPEVCNGQSRHGGEERYW
jgi:hypothetical protein